MEGFFVPQARPMLPPDPEISERAYAFLTDLVYRQSRIRLGPDKRAFVAGRLAGRLRAIGCSSYDDYCRLLDAPAGEEAERLVELISTNHTHFFREPDHFTFLASDVLPAATTRAATCGSGLPPRPRARRPTPWRS